GAGGGGVRVWLVPAAEPIRSDGVRPLRFMRLARALAGRGHDVTLWTQTFFHHTKRHRFPTDAEYEAEGYRVVMLRGFGYRKNVSLRRYASHWRFAQRLAAAMPARPAPDVVVTSLPPLDTVAAVAAYCAARAIPFVVDVIDPWPDVFVELLRAAGLDNVEFLGWLDAGALARLLGTSDLGLACYRRGATQTVTYKLFEYLAAGLPVLCSLAGEMGDVLRRERVGFVYRAEDPADLARVIRDCGDRGALAPIAARARRVAETLGDAPRVYRDMARLLETAARAPLAATA